MENESNLINNFDMIEENTFMPEYENQNIYNTQAFKNWQNSNFKKYGKEAKLFHCIYNKIYFYVSDNECQKYPYYRVKCPKCNYYICYCCSSIDEKRNLDCCLKRRIYSCFHIKQVYDMDGPCRNPLMYMIPFFSMIYIIESITNLTLYNRSIKYISYPSYGDYFGNWNCMKFYNSMFAKLLSIAFFSNNIIFVLFIWIISIPFKLAPVKYIANAINNGFSI